MEIIPSGQTLGASISGTLHNVVADATADEPRTTCRPQVTALFNHPAPVA